MNLLNTFFSFFKVNGSKLGNSIVDAVLLIVIWLDASVIHTISDYLKAINIVMVGLNDFLQYLITLMTLVVVIYRFKKETKKGDPRE